MIIIIVDDIVMTKIIKLFQLNNVKLLTSFTKTKNHFFTFKNKKL